MTVIAVIQHEAADENQTRRYIKQALLHNARYFFRERCKKSNTATNRIKFIHARRREMKRRSCYGRSEVEKQEVFSS
jgi:hypothetical protein